MNSGWPHSPVHLRPTLLFTITQYIPEGKLTKVYVLYRDCC